MSLKLAIVLHVLLIIHQSHAQQSDIAPHIVGGRNAAPGEFPYQVSLQFGSNPQATGHFCGGSILTPNWIITAGHCANFIKERNRPGASFVVKAGKWNLHQLESTEQKSVIGRYFIFPKYEATNDNSLDIALLKLQTPLRYNTWVSAIYLPPRGSDPRGIGTASGWGGTYSGSPIPSILQTADLPIIDRQSCIRYLQAYGDRNPNIKETTVCAGLDKSGCSGDSGSPLAQKMWGKPVIVGVMSWASNPCQAKNFPTGFVRVGSFIDWILDTIRRN